MQPFVGPVLWGPRVGFLLIHGVLIAAIFDVIHIETSGEKSGFWLLLAVAITAYFVFEIVVISYKWLRRRVHSSGTDYDACVVHKVITPRGGIYKLVLSYQVGGWKYVVGGYVSARTFWQLKNGDSVRIRVLPSLPKLWVRVGLHE